MRITKEFLHIYLPEMIENHVKIDTIGEYKGLPDHTREAINHAKEETKENTGLVLNFALNYGSRNEIIEAVKLISKDRKSTRLNSSHVAISYAVFCLKK